MGNVLPKAVLLVVLLGFLALLLACSSATNVDSGSPGSETGADPAVVERKIVRTAETDLAVKDLNEALADIRAIAAESGGFVSSSNVVVSNSDDEQAAELRTSSVTIRVPVSRYEEVMDRLRGIAAGVDSEQSASREVTSEYTDLQARLTNLQRSETAYLALLEKAQSIEEILRVQEYVNGTQGEIEQVQGQLNVLNNQADLATITISLRLAGTPAGGGNWAASAFETSLNVSEQMLVFLGTTAIAGAFAMVWVVPPLLVAYFIWRRFGARIAAMARKLG